ncbi:MAG: transposase [Burkholderiales bacterium]
MYWPFESRAVNPASDQDSSKDKRIERLKKFAAQMRQWLGDNPEDRRGAKGAIRKSNRANNESAKMATSEGVIQGYCGVVAVDSAHQVNVEAQAHGSGSEQELLVPVVEPMRDLIEKDSIVTADAGYHGEANLKALAESNFNALIADNAIRKRDERFAAQDKHKAQPDPLWDKTPNQKKTRLFGPRDFHHDEKAARACVCRCWLPGP